MAHERSMEMIGGDLALDFANTAGWHARDHPVEHLDRYEDFLAWARRSGVISPVEERTLERRGKRSPRERTRALGDVRVLREVIYRVFAAVAAGAPPRTKDLAALRVRAAAALSSGAATWGGGGGATGVRIDWSRSAGLDWPAHPIALAALALLSSPALPRVRQCGNHPCGWLFLDTTRNHSRRWCTSAECGNASRVRRFRARKS